MLCDQLSQLTMAVCRPLTRLSSVVSACSFYFKAPPARHFHVTASFSIRSSCRPLKPLKHERRRPLSTSANRRNIGQQAPSAYTYMQSRVTDGDRKNLVDVKKVLVIGSGGLSIG